jgi:hypothetical protein
MQQPLPSLLHRPFSLRVGVVACLSLGTRRDRVEAQGCSPYRSRRTSNWLNAQTSPHGTASRSMRQERARASTISVKCWIRSLPGSAVEPDPGAIVWRADRNFLVLNLVRPVIAAAAGRVWEDKEQGGSVDRRERLLDARILPPQQALLRGTAHHSSWLQLSGLPSHDPAIK